MLRRAVGTGRRWVPGWTHENLLQDMAERWHLDLGPLVRRGTVSVVVPYRTPRDARVVLKVSSDPARITAEARALADWRTTFVSLLLVSDLDRGVLLIGQACRRADVGQSWGRMLQ
jgi:hypothetical protein